MAYLRELPRPRCYRCGKAARYEVLNRENASHGFYCRACGEKTRRELERTERAKPCEACRRDTMFAVLGRLGAAP